MMKRMVNFMVWATMPIALSAQTLTTLHTFNGGDGAGPGGFVQATSGDFYGTTVYYGVNNAGTVFKVTPGGILTTLYYFCSQGGVCADGEGPYGLIQVGSGEFYGVTVGGGINNEGTIFKITPSGKLTTLYRFCSQGACTDGAKPSSGLIQAANGNLYGTTADGGASGGGTIFTITPSGKLTTLYSFCSQSNCADGQIPASLIQATNGDLYGITMEGGPNSGGTIFKITPGGTLNTLYSFNGELSSGTLVQATNGEFYGTTGSGGTNNGGTIFKISPSGALTTLYNFCPQSACSDGQLPNSLMQATNGSFYGTTFLGGSDSCSGGCGIGFTLSVGLGPFVKTLPASGKVGAVVKILGNNLTGATSVSFNGTAATFQVASSSEITTTVPAGASSGKVQVRTPHRTLSSNVPFRVLP